MVSGPEHLDEIKANLEAGGRQWRRGENLLRAFGYVRRRQSAVDWIKDELQQRGMRTNPPLSTEMPLEGFISFSLVGARSSASESSPIVGPAPPSAELFEVEDETQSPEEPPTEVVSEQEEESLRPDVGGSAELAVKIANLAAAERTPVTISPDSTVEEALSIMESNGYSQLVVVTGPRAIQGIVSFKSISKALLWGLLPSSFATI